MNKTIQPLFKLLALALLGTATAASLPALPSQANAGNARRAQEVLEQLRPQLPAIAKAHGLTTQALEKMVKQDRDLWIDEGSRLFYVCEGVALDHDHHEEALVAEAATVSTAVPNSTDAFKLHSLPGANRVIYLDFNGHTTSGTSWNTSKTGGADIVSAPFDFDGNPTNWSAEEQDRIKRIWQRVAEDYMPFAVDVTTEDPGVEALRRTTTADTQYGIRVVISPSSAWYGNAGGVAYLGSFQASSDTPCFVFSDKLGPNGEKPVAEAISHEAGHTLGLSHDGKTDGTGYYSGHGDWAPIMGVGYYKPVTQWSKGEYALANNLQDDLAVMPNYGAPLALDDCGNDLSTTSVLTGPSVLTVGVIESARDVDVYRFNTGAGTINFELGSPSVESNLNIRAELLSSTGVVLATSDRTDLGASLSLAVATGTYYLRIQGVGTGDPLSTGYSDYASLGEYKISGSLVSTGAAVAPVAVVSATPTSGTGPLTATFSAAGSSDADGSIVSYAWNFGDGSTGSGASATHVYSAAGTYIAQLTVTDNTGLTGSASVTIVVSAAANQAPVAVASASVQSGPAPLSVIFSSAGSTDSDGAITAYYWDFGDGTSSTAANPSKTYTIVGSFSATLTVTDDRGAKASSSVAITTSAGATYDIDVSSLQVTTRTTSAGTQATAVVKIADSRGLAVPGATVTLQWSGIVTGSATGTTDSTGTVTFTSKRVKKSGTITASVTAVGAPAGYRYSSTLFAEPLNESVTL